MDIKDKIAIVTGASAGIGLALARLLAEKGATVILAARSADKLNQLEKEIPGSVAIPADMQKPGDIRNLIREVQDKFGRIDILVNNAGQGLLSSVEAVDLDEYRSIMELNVFAVLSAMQQVIPVMRKHGRGTILNVSSMVSKNTFPMLAAYVSQAGFPRWTGGRDGGAVSVALRRVAERCNPHDAPFLTAKRGSKTSKQAPRPSRGRHRTLPPCRSAICRTRVRPRPAPPAEARP